MPLLIDCYNVLHAEKPPLLAGLDVAGLCRALGRSGWARESIVVVCDGEASPLGLTESPVATVELVYSGAHRTADRVIIDRINRDTAPRRLLVVSTDHEIRQAARRRAAGVQRSETFLHTLARQLGRPRSIPPADEKPNPADISEAEVDRWLEQFGYEPAAASSHWQSPPPKADDLRPEDDPDVPWPPPDVERGK
jgi:hypothetical protein